MNRNTESRFAINPTNIDISRSKFERSSSLKTSFNVGDIIPIYFDEILPGDSVHIETSKVVRMQSLITPVMDNMYLDTYYFFVPNRLVWSHWKEFMGENSQSAWIPQVEYQIPQITPPVGGWNVGTLADYFGLPTGVDGFSVSALPFRAYALIMNEWFRSENLSNPLNIPVDDTTIQGVNTGVDVTDVVKGGLPYKAAKYHDYFTSALPGPQKGPSVGVPLTGIAPVFGVANTPMNMAFTGAFDNGGDTVNVNRYGSVGGFRSSSTAYLGFGSDIKADSIGNFNTNWASATDLPVNSSAIKANIVPDTGTGLVKSNVYANLTGGDAVIGVNELRLAFQLQKLYEKDARGGSRYIELLKSHFGVTSPDARLQRPEYLGGNRLPINVHQVVQTSETASTPQGTTAAYSLTTDFHDDFRKSFVEHGMLIGVGVVRYDHTYQQGIPKYWSRKGRFDFYWPVLANIGEQPILNQEIYVNGSLQDTEVFGYQEAWADYRYKPSIVTGEMRSSATLSLDSWHLADDYSSRPYLSDEWIREDKSNVDRVLAVQSSVSNQLFGDFYFKCEMTRAMPLYSIPGLIDHH